MFKKLYQKLEQINSELNPQPIIKLNISYGDEIAGLFDNPSQIYKVISELRETLYPHTQLRFVVAFGKIGVVSNDITKVGGVVFKQADAQLQRLKKGDGFCFWMLQDPMTSSILNSLTEMSNAIVERMSFYQRHVWHYLEKGLLQKEISRKLNKYPQSVSDAVKRGGADMVMRAEKIINQILENLVIN